MQHNVYFGGDVQSLTLSKGKEKATVGVMKPGRYTFSTSSEEHMTVISGALSVLLPGTDEWRNYTEGQTFVVPPGQSFDVESTGDSAYLCVYR